MPGRIGAYILPGDVVWLEKSLGAYYPLLSDLVVPIPADGRGWRGQPIPVADALARIRRVDHRNLLRTTSGSWTDLAAPIRADTAQRQHALDALRGCVDWVLQLDSDEFLPDPDALLGAIEHAQERGIDAVEWPMRVLYRRSRRWVFEIVDRNGRARYDYPGAVAVRPGVTLVDARRTDGEFLRPVVHGDDASLQVARSAIPGEHRWEGLDRAQAIVHNSWARTAPQIWRKMHGWGHWQGWRSTAYFLLRWLPTPVLWWAWRDVHPFAHGLWPRLKRTAITEDLTDDRR